MDKALLVFIAIVISAFIGGLVNFSNKLFKNTTIHSYLKLPATLLREIEQKISRNNIKPEEKQASGFLFTISLLAVGAFIGWLFSIIFVSPFFTIILLSISLPIGSSWMRVNTLKKNLQKGNIALAREQLDGTVFRHHAILDSPALTRAAIEYLTVQFFQKIFTTVFWFFLLGLAGMFASITLYFMNETLANPINKPSSYGKSINRIEAVINYIPTRLCAFLWILSTIFLPSSDWKKISERAASGILSENSNCLALLCTASGLNLSLGGKTSAYCNERWIGTGKIAVSTADISRTQFLFAISNLLLSLIIGIFI